MRLTGSYTAAATLLAMIVDAGPIAPWASAV